MVTPHPTGGRVSPAVALALLESLRLIDTPPEDDPGDEDLPAVPRRLGLSSAVEEQIHRYARLRRNRDGLPEQEVVSLFGLIGRRPDARLVFARAGLRLAELYLEDRGIPSRVASSAAPPGLRHRLALRHLGRLVQRANPGGQVRIERRPVGLIVQHCLPARAVGGSEGCALVAGAMERLLATSERCEVAVAHPLCEGRREPHCLWSLEGSPA